MLERLTKAQEALLAVYRDRWTAIGRSTGPCDRERVEAGVDACYRAAGMVPPATKEWVGSPLAGMRAAQACTSTQVDAPVWAQVRAQVREQVRAPVWAQVSMQVYAQVYAPVEAQVVAPVWAQVRAEGTTRIPSCYGTQDAAWLAMYAYFGEVCGLAETVAPLRGFQQMAEAGGGWWWLFEQKVILSPRPTAIHLDEQGRLHHETGMAVQYPDGWGVYAWHGVRVPADVILHPEQITLAAVLTERNQEVRRIMLARHGWERVIAALGARAVHQDRFGVLYETDQLGQYLTGEDPVARFVKVVDPSTGRRYALRVPPAVATAHAAVAWTFEQSEEQYDPIRES